MMERVVSRDNALASNDSLSSVSLSCLNNSSAVYSSVRIQAPSLDLDILLTIALSRVANTFNAAYYSRFRRWREGVQASCGSGHALRFSVRLIPYRIKIAYEPVQVKAFIIS